MYINCFDEVKKITEDLVRTKSVVKTMGEKDCAQVALEYYKGLEYFKANPEYLIFQQTEDDEIERYNVVAMVRGTKGSSRNAVLLMGHIDTVGVDDYGPIIDSACDPDALPRELLKLPLDEGVKKDIASGEYMFGRGALDMKSGVAGHMYLIKYFAEHPEELDGTLIAMAQCDEEDNSHGAISCLTLLGELKEKYGFNYIAGINADYSTPYFDGDVNRYVFFGTIGKMLPSFYAVGKEAHVGQAFSALDPNMLIAEITRLMSLNADLCDESQGEVTVPPVSLKQADFKDTYTVQTAIAAHGYYNFFVHKMSPQDVMDKVVPVAETAFDNVIAALNQNYEKYCKLTGATFSPLPWKTKVLTWDGFYKKMQMENGDVFTAHMRDFAANLHANQPDLDLRKFSVQVVAEAFKWSKDKSPVVIVYFSSTFCARIEMTGETDMERRLTDAVDTAIAGVQPQSSAPIKTKMFYPYIADMSFMGMSDSRESLTALADNMPAWGSKYLHPIDKILNINVPVVNIGTYGKDGHMLTERVHMGYTFENVPNITYNTIKKLLD